MPDTNQEYPFGNPVNVLKPNFSKLIATEPVTIENTEANPVPTKEAVAEQT